MSLWWEWNLKVCILNTNKYYSWTLLRWLQVSKVIKHNFQIGLKPNRARFLSIILLNWPLVCITSENLCMVFSTHTVHLRAPSSALARQHKDSFSQACKEGYYSYDKFLQGYTITIPPWGLWKEEQRAPFHVLEH